MPIHKRIATWRIGAVVLCGAAVLLLGACGAQAPTPFTGAGSSATPTYDPNEFELTPVIPLATKWPPATPAPQPTANPDDGVGYSVIADFAPPPTPEEFATWYSTYFVGRVTKILPAQWSTPDGKRPPGIIPGDMTDTYIIITPAVVTLDRPPLLDRAGIDATSGTIVVAAFGGTIGKDSIDINDPSQHLHVGDHLLISVSDHPYMGTKLHVPYWTPAGPAWTLGMVYWLEADGLALAGMPNATPVATQDLIQAIIAASRSTPTP